MASPVSTVGSAAHPLSLIERFSSASVVAGSDDDHLCSAPTGVAFEYGNQTNQDEIISDCDKVSQKIKAAADEQGNFTEMCGTPPGFGLFSSEGSCSMWFQCQKTTEGLQVT